MRISSKPKPPFNCVKFPQGKVRWVRRFQCAHHMGEGVGYEVMVLQQLFSDGHDSPFWEDVQVEPEFPTPETT